MKKSIIIVIVAVVSFLFWTAFTTFAFTNFDFEAFEAKVDMTESEVAIYATKWYADGMYIRTSNKMIANVELAYYPKGTQKVYLTDGSGGYLATTQGRQYTNINKPVTFSVNKLGQWKIDRFSTTGWNGNMFALDLDSINCPSGTCSTAYSWSTSLPYNLLPKGLYIIKVKISSFVVQGSESNEVYSFDKDKKFDYSFEIE